LKPKVALIEFNSYHDECLLSIAHYLNTHGYQVEVFVNSKLKNKLEHLASDFSVHYLNLSKSKYLGYVQLFCHLRFRGFKISYFNTAEHKKLLKFFKYFRIKGVKNYGTLHNAYKLEDDPIQLELHSYFESYFVLSDYIKSNISYSQLLPVYSLYTIKKPNFVVDKTVIKPKGEYWIIVPGSLEFNRRDYRSLAQLDIPDNFRIILLGSKNKSHGNEIYNFLSNHKDFRKFIFFEDFVSSDKFYSYLNQADYIKPLVHKNEHSFEHFFKYKITGSFNLAFSLKKVLLMDSSFKLYEDFVDSSVFYDSDNLNSIWTAINEKCNSNFYTNPKWNLAYQAKLFCDKIN